MSERPIPGLNLHRDKNSKGVNRGEMGISLSIVTTVAGWQRGPSAISEMKTKTKQNYFTTVVRYFVA